MDEKQAVTSLAALAHEQRLRIFRILVTQGPNGMPAGEIAAFKALVPETVAGDRQTYVFQPGHIEFYNNGKLLGRVDGATFSRLLLSTWIGAVPPTAELRSALLGQ